MFPLTVYRRTDRSGNPFFRDPCEPAIGVVRSIKLRGNAKKTIVGFLGVRDRDEDDIHVLRFRAGSRRCALQWRVCPAGNYMPRQKGCQVLGSLNPDILCSKKRDAPFPNCINNNTPSRTAWQSAFRFLYSSISMEMIILEKYA